MGTTAPSWTQCDATSTRHRTTEMSTWLKLPKLCMNRNSGFTANNLYPAPRRNVKVCVVDVEQALQTAHESAKGRIRSS